LELKTGQTSVIFNKMFVNVIDTNSGIFIGVNNALGWSSHGKSNSGFGSASNCKVSGNIHVVYDQDVIDAPIEDLKNVVTHSSADSQLNSNLHFKSINANTLLTNSTISVGENDQTAWSSHRKNNYGNGKTYGLNVLKHLVNSIKDNDWVDSPIQHSSTPS
jgi:hypothetical protein